jgi:hypothetical protein
MDNPKPDAVNDVRPDEPESRKRRDAGMPEPPEKSRASQRERAEPASGDPNRPEQDDPTGAELPGNN